MKRIWIFSRRLNRADRISRLINEWTKPSDSLKYIGRAWIAKMRKFSCFMLIWRRLTNSHFVPILSLKSRLTLKYLQGNCFSDRFIHRMCYVYSTVLSILLIYFHTKVWKIKSTYYFMTSLKVKKAAAPKVVRPWFWTLISTFWRWAKSTTAASLWQSRCISVWVGGKVDYKLTKITWIGPKTSRGRSASSPRTLNCCWVRPSWYTYTLFTLLQLFECM